jgi:hypothetical protein
MGPSAHQAETVLPTRRTPGSAGSGQGNLRRRPHARTADSERRVVTGQPPHVPKVVAGVGVAEPVIGTMCGLD